MFLVYDESFWALHSWHMWYITSLGRSTFFDLLMHRLPLTLAFFDLLTFSLTGLLAIWGGLGRPHWFVRATVVLAGLSFWLFVPAYEPMLIFFTQAAVAAPLLSWAKSHRAGVQHAQSRRLPQFTVRDILLLTVVVALVSASATRVTTEVWRDSWKYLLHGTAYGLLTVIAAWVALGRSRWWLRMIGGFLAFPSALMVGWILLGRWSGVFGEKSLDRAMFRYGARAGFATTSLLILLPSTFLYYELATPAPIPVAAMPEPNGYDDLVRAGKSLENITVPTRTDGVDAILSFVQKHDSALQSARNGLDRKCQTPVRYDTDTLLAEHVQYCRPLAQAFLAEGILAEEEGRTEDAMRVHYDNIRLGTAIAHGGLLIDRIIGLAYERYGRQGLGDLSDDLSADQCHRLIELLEKSKDGWDSLADCYAREQAWIDNVNGWRGRFWNTADRICDMLHALPAKEKGLEVDSQDLDFRHEAKRRLLIGKLAICCYRLERGELPDALADLVPDYLPEIPEDPFSSKPLIYRLTGDKYLLYSIGRDRIDDGGQPFVTPNDPYSGEKDILPDTTADNKPIQ